MRFGSAWLGFGARLPRETRDTLFMLLVIGWIVVLQIGHIPSWAIGVALAALAWRGWLAWHKRALPSWRWRLLLTAVAVGLTVATHRTVLGPNAGVTLLVMLLAFKTLELRAQRDAYVVFFLGFFALLTLLLHSQSLLMALGIGSALWGLLSALVLAQLPNGRPPLWQAARTAGGIALAGAPLMALLFALFPRLPPLWAVPTDTALGRSGLSGRMQVGDVARLAMDGRVAFRVAFPDGTPPREALYFRGPVLRVFDGRIWRPLHGPDATIDVPTELLRRHDKPARVEIRGPALRYQITMEPSLRPWLLTLEATVTAPVLSAASADLAHTPVHVSPDRQWWLSRPITDLLRYEARAFPVHRVDVHAERLALQIDRELPPGYNPRTLAWAQALRRALGDPEPRQLVDAVLRHLRDGGYQYTLEPGVYGRDTADEFWFDRRRGFCEHIASAFAVAMRALDIPARVVTGYQGGERNPVDGLWTVRQSDAHAWVEVWLANEGWVRIDPTAYVAPDRTAVGERLQPPPGLVASALVRTDLQLLRTLRAAWDAVNQRWNDWILDYGPTRQLDLLHRLGVSASGWQDVARVLGIALTVAAAACGALLLWHRPRTDRWHRLLARAAQRWERYGVPRPEPLTPMRLRQAIAAHLGPNNTTFVAQAWSEWLTTLEALRYDPRHTTTQNRSMAKLSDLARCLPDLPMPPPPAPVAPARRLVVLGWLLAATLGGALAPADGLAQDTAAALTAYADRPDARALAAAIDTAEGWHDGWAQRWIAQARHDPRAQRMALPPPTVDKDWATYRARFVEPRRIRAGVRFWDEHQAALERAQAHYGVPAWLIVGIIGVETLYGQQMGNYRTLDVLATLALDYPAEHPRANYRQAYFQEELRAFLRLARRTDVPPDRWRGSYAGALGWPQFMPSSYLAYAVDFDGDGRIDLRASATDAIGSVAHFLHAHGWQRDLPVRFDVAPPPPGEALTKLLAPDIRPTFTLDQIRALGARPAAEADGYRGLLALVELQNGDPARGGAPPTYVLGTENFYVITRYNRSSYYAMAVIDLGLAVQGARRALGKHEQAAKR